MELVELVEKGNCEEGSVNFIPLFPIANKILSAITTALAVSVSILPLAIGYCILKFRKKLKILIC